MADQQYNQSYYQTNKEKLQKYKKAYYQKNKTRLVRKSNQYRDANKDQINERIRIRKALALTAIQNIILQLANERDLLKSELEFIKQNAPGKLE